MYNLWSQYRHTFYINIIYCDDGNIVQLFIDIIIIIITMLYYICEKDEKT